MYKRQTVFNGIVNLGFTCVAIFTVEKLGQMCIRDRDTVVCIAINFANFLSEIDSFI